MGCRLGVALGKELEAYSFVPPHPFNRERYIAFKEGIERSRIKFAPVTPEAAGREVISLFHTEDHIDFVKKMSEAGEGYLDGGDTPAFKGIFEAASYVVGTTIKLADLVAEGEFDHCFNPVGGLHHASRNKSAGFCVFNDICVAIEYLRKKGFRRFLYVDIDVHHGDGVFYSYEEDPDIYILDVHEDGRFQYPGTGFESERGKGKAEGTKLNIPLYPGTGDEAIGRIVSVIDEIATKSKPDFIILQAGADSILGDMLGNLSFSPAYHESVARRLHEISHEYCGGRMIALGGGGYNVGNCVRAWLSVCSELSVM